jgi:hypothetical protein
VTVQLPTPGRSAGEVVLSGRLFGDPDQAFARAAENSIPQMMADIRRELQNVEDRRKHPRLAAGFAINLYPLHSDGGVDPPIPARCKDVSAGGLALTVETRLTTKYSYVAFEGVAATTGLAILIRMMRSQQQGTELLVGGRYRTDL